MAKNNRKSGQTRFAQTSPLFLLTPSVHGLRFSKIPAQCVLQEMPVSLETASSIRFPRRRYAAEHEKKKCHGRKEWERRAPSRIWGSDILSRILCRSI